MKSARPPRVGSRIERGVYDLLDQPDGIEAPSAEIFRHNFLYGANGLTLGDGDYVYEPTSVVLIDHGNCVAGDLVPPAQQCDSDVPGFAGSTGFDFRLGDAAEAIDEGDDSYVRDGELRGHVERPPPVRGEAPGDKLQAITATPISGTHQDSSKNESAHQPSIVADSRTAPSLPRTAAPVGSARYSK